MCEEKIQGDEIRADTSRGLNHGQHSICGIKKAIDPIMHKVIRSHFPLFSHVHIRLLSRCTIAKIFKSLSYIYRILDGYYVAYKPITLLFISFMFIKMKSIYCHSYMMFVMKFVSISYD